MKISNANLSTERKILKEAEKIINQANNKQELSLKKQNKIVYDFKVFGGRYAYLKDEIFSDDNMVFEMHYTMIDDWKKIKPDIKTIYILPQDLSVPKTKAKERNLSKEKEIERINEIDEQYNRFMNDKVFQSKFDYILYNNYDKKSEEQLLNLIRNLISK